MAKTDTEVLARLFAVIEQRRGGDPAKSYVAKQLGQGTHRIAQKLGEEAVETLIEGMRGDRERLTEESADLLYHLLVLWAAKGVTPARVWAVLEGRRGTSGLAEKAARGKKP